MKEVILPNPAVIEDAAESAAGKDRKRPRGWTCLLFLSVPAGIGAALAGLFLGAISYLGFVENADRINQLGNFLIIAAFPLTMCGAHALDKINELEIDRNRR